ncbi:DUF1049 domain-containing protein [Pseudomonas aylmerensis]|uniref:DUF1049 domain-containing protein n=1 Tax=Pseudomonas aylmerensis TaxID=1869229 RepID=A0A2T4FS98_9PSED|nr:lipopolysaccharide assembly protein LapA domain-containing protein [Pseudomonas aylmerensis]OCW29307.1 hypothetical protein BBG20_07585 [Pseudomonas aylmerensis]PTC26243.1 DUF1049 domain-containing protein [Pseudomonas aylmerensis]
MYHARRALLALILLIVALGVLVFVLENQQVLALSFLGWATPQIPVSIFIALSLLVGLLLGPLLGFIFRRKASRLSVSSGR